MHIDGSVGFGSCANRKALCWTLGVGSLKAVRRRFDFFTLELVSFGGENRYDWTQNS